MWTRALRFFRYSQLADDVFDAYRNLFLALEAVLSELVSGGPGGEREWLEHALKHLVAAGELDLSRYTPSGEPDPLEHFLREQYAARRCATFHAKSHRDVLTPGSAEDRETVASALEHLARIVMDLSEKVVQRRRPGGALTFAGFEGFFIAPKVGKLAMSLARQSDDGRGSGPVELETKYLGHDPTNRGEHVFAAAPL